MRSLLLLLLLSLLTGCSRFEPTPAEVASRVDPEPYESQTIDLGPLFAAAEMSLENDALILAQLAEINAALSERPVTPTDPPADEAAHWSELADLVESEDIETVQQLLAVIDDMAANGHLTDVSRVRALRGTTGPIEDVARIVRMLLGSQPPPGNESPFETDQLRVLIVLEKSAPTPPELTRSAAWLLQEIPGRFVKLDDDLTDADLQFHESWVRGAYAAWIKVGRPLPGLIVGAPNHGYAGPWESLEQVRELTWLECE